MKSKLLFLILAVYNFESAQVPGCTDPVSSNYNPAATVNNGSCIYPSATVSPVTSVNLPEAVKETSGLIKWNGKLYTHNDGADTKLYALDSISGAVVQSVTIPGVVNKDWEELAQDNSHLYIGDFGNNGNGNRNNLKIIKVSKESVLAGAATTETINFTYSNQTNFTATGGNNTDFDCEAMIVSADSIYLFTKQWVSKKTSVYALPKTAGTHVAQFKVTHNVGGLITGAAYVENKRVVVLTGYSNLLQPFLYLLYDFQGHTFFSGNKRKIGVSLSFHQIEGIATSNGLDYFATNEFFTKQPFLTTQQQLHKFDLRAYLNGYLTSQVLLTQSYLAGKPLKIYPNPVGDRLFIDGDNIAGAAFIIVDTQGKEVFNGKLNSDKNEYNIETLPAGMYFVKMKGRADFSLKLLKK